MANEQTFFEIDTEECLNIYPKVIANAKEFFACADLLGEQKFYGKAISLMILGTEEYIKSLVVFLEGKGFELRKIEGVKPIFYRHTYRHNILRDTYSVWLVLKNLYTINGPISARKILKHFLKATLNILPAINNNQWWSQADNLKNRGLYVDYRSELLMPSDLSIEDFRKTHRFINPIQKEIQEFILCVNNMTDQDLKNFRKLFHESRLGNIMIESFRR